MNDLSKFDIATTVTDSLIDLFDSMMSMDLELSDEEAIAGMEGERIAGSVRMAGRVMGCVNIQVSDVFSKMMTAAMLGIEDDELESEEEVIDVISEVCNIVGGNLKSKFCDSGLTCQLSPPAFTRGNDFTIESLDTVRHEQYIFVYENHPIIVDVGVRVNEDESVQVLESQKGGLQLPPIDKEGFLRFNIRKPVSNSMVEMFDMMLSMDLVESKEDLVSQLKEDKIVGTVGFVGRLMGMLQIYVSEEFAQVMTATMLGIEVDEVEGFNDIRDVVSEVCNIIGGNLKSKMDNNGFNSNLSTPSMTFGSDFTIESKNMARYEKLAYRCGDEVIFVEVGLNAEDEMKASQVDEVDAATPILDPQQSVNQMMDEDEQAPQPPAADEPEPEASDFIPLAAAESQPAGEEEISEQNLEFLLDVPVCVTVELGRTRKKISEVLAIDNGTVVELTKLADEPVDIMVKNTLIAKGEIVVDRDKYGVRILETISRLQRIRSL